MIHCLFSWFFADTKHTLCYAKGGAFLSMERTTRATEEQLLTSSRVQRYVNYANRANISDDFNIV